MVKRRSRLKSVSRRVSNLNHNNDVSTHTLMIMVILILVVSIFSATLYVYTFYGNSNYNKFQNSLSESPVMEESGAVSGAVSIQIIKPPEENEAHDELVK